jgi:hypothetical protein
MGTRNRVGIGLSYRPASLCSSATQFQTRFLESIPRPIRGTQVSDSVFLKRINISFFLFLSQSEEENEIRHRFRSTEASALSEGSSPTGGWQEVGEEEGEEAEAKKRLWIEKDPETNQIFRRIQQVSSHWLSIPSRLFAAETAD